MRKLTGLCFDSCHKIGCDESTLGLEMKKGSTLTGENCITHQHIFLQRLKYNSNFDQQLLCLEDVSTSLI